MELKNRCLLGISERLREERAGEGGQESVVSGGNKKSQHTWYMVENCPGQKPRSKLTSRKEQNEKWPTGFNWDETGFNAMDCIEHRN